MTEGKLTFRGIGIHYRSNGVGAPLLLVHGNVASSEWWRESMEIAGFAVTAVDLPNFGRSDPLPLFDAATASLDAYADVLNGFIGAAGLVKPVVVGHSLGGAVVQALVARHPDCARALALVDSGAPSGLATPEDRYPMIEMMRTDPRILTMALKAVVPTLTDDARLAELVAEARLMAAPAWTGNAAALTRFDYRGRLSGFKGKVLVVWGRRDAVVSEAMARETAAAFPNAELRILETVGHGVMVEDPALWVRTLREFLAGL